MEEPAGPRLLALRGLREEVGVGGALLVLSVDLPGLDSEGRLQLLRLGALRLALAGVDEGPKARLGVLDAEQLGELRVGLQASGRAGEREGPLWLATRQTLPAWMKFL